MEMILIAAICFIAGGFCGIAGMALLQANNGQ